MAPVEIRVAYHPESKLCEEIAKEIHSHYCRRPDSLVLYSTIGIPVSYITEPDKLDIETSANNDGQHIFVILLMDEHMIKNTAWIQAMKALQDKKASSLTIIPLGYTEYAEKIFSRIDVKIYERENYNDPLQWTLSQLSLALSHHLLPNRDKLVFVSYARSDGSDLAERIRSGLLDKQSTLIPFVDKIDLKCGDDFSDEISERIHRSLFMLILTDKYSSRSWCAHELLTAKEANVPILIVDAIENRAERLLPYAGNAPVVRWHGESTDFERMAEQVAYEFIRHSYRLAELNRAAQNLPCDSEVKVFPSHPEIHTLCDVPSNTVVLYPEPPITFAEQSLIEKHFPDLSLRSFAQFVGCGDACHQEDRRCIQLSAALPELSLSSGIGVEHFNEAVADLSKHLFLAGYDIGYGGDWRRGGLTEIIVEAASAYSASDAPYKLHNYFSEACSREDESSARIEYLKFVEVTNIPAATKEGVSIPHPNDELIERAWKSVSLTHMRKTLSENVCACIFIGGKTDEGSPKGYPGLLEEFFYAASRKIPIYLIGAFGGCTEAIVQALQNKLEISSNFPNMFDQGFAQAYSTIAQKNELPNYCPQEIAALIQGNGWDILNNGLTDQENEKLATTKYSVEIARLVLKGLATTLGND